MQQILKRLELIKNSIALDDIEIIQIQTGRLKSLDTDAELDKILEKLENSDFGNAIVEIDNYISKSEGIIPYEDEELQGLRLELKVLEKALQNQSEIRDEYLSNIHDFNIQYNMHLGKLIQKILKKREEIEHKNIKHIENSFTSIIEEYTRNRERYEELRSQIDELEKRVESIDIFDELHDKLYADLQVLKERLYRQDAKLRKSIESAKNAKKILDSNFKYQEYMEAKKDYEEFCGNYEEAISEERFELNEDEKKELKIAYKRAAKLCHPDIVSDSFKERAHKIISELNEAYHKRDLSRVKMILISLESGSKLDSASDTIDDKTLLRVKIDDLREKIRDVKRETEEIKQDETFILLQKIDDMDQYFLQMESQLKGEYLKLEQQR